MPLSIFYGILMIILAFCPYLDEKENLVFKYVFKIQKRSREERYENKTLLSALYKAGKLMTH